MIEIPGYRIDEELGSGGMGAVYRGVHLASGERVAIKVITGGSADPAAVERFKREAEVLTQLAHPGVLAAREFGVSDGRPFLVTRLIAGDSLLEVVERAGPLAEGEVGYLGQQLAKALAHAHQRGVLHRDLKPENVVLTAAGQPILIDFGLAKRLHDGGGGKLTESGMVIGTPLFMAPEQALGERAVGPATDLYGLGATLFFLLTGKAPFSDEGGPFAVLRRVAHDSPRSLRELRPDVGETLAAIVERCMARSPEARYASAFQVAQELGELPLRQRLRGGSLLSGVRALVWPRNRRGLGLRAGVLVGLGLVGAALTGVVTEPASRDEGPSSAPAPRLRGHVARVLAPPVEDRSVLLDRLAGLVGDPSVDAGLERAVVLAQQGELEAARGELEVLLEAAPGQPLLAPRQRAEVLATLGAVLHREGSRLQALVAYEQALGLAGDPDWANARKACWAELLEEPRYQSGGVGRGEAKAHAELASQLAARDCHDAALVEYGHALELYPGSEFSRIRRGRLYAKLKQYDLALADYSRLVEDHPLVHHYRVVRAKELERRGELDLALADYDVALSPDAEDPKGIVLKHAPKRHLWHYRRALIEDRLGMRQEAVADLRAALELGLDGQTRTDAQNLLIKLDLPF